MPFSHGWKFCRTSLGVTPGEVLSHGEWFEPVELPHDWLIYDVNALYQDGCGWYRKDFVLPQPQGPVILRFDGVYMDSSVYVNGRWIGDWKYGYSTFDMDVTEAVREGQNQILVQVRYQAPNSRWYSGAGIYRRVWLKLCAQAYLPWDGTYVSVRQKGEGYVLEADTETAGETASCFLRYRLIKDGETVGEPVKVSCGQSLQMWVERPLLWDVEDPQCYELSVELAKKNRAGQEEILDAQKVTVGFRTIAFDPQRGCFLNGRKLKLNGVCEHHDLGCLGAAFHLPALERKLKAFQAMGVNAIRTSHNMQAPEFFDLTDRMGFLVVSEAFDMWERPKTEFDYARFFPDWAERDVRSWIRRDRNHPSLLFWSIGNEIYDTHADGHGVEITRRLLRYVREHDSRGNAPVTIGSNYMPWENAQKCADVLKFAGYNYGEKYYEAHHAAHPDWIMYGSETASIVQSRGIYHFPLRSRLLAEEDGQCSALGNSTTSWGAKSLEECIAVHRDRDYLLGQFIWSGSDYIGEPTPYHTKNSYFGQIDTAGFPKDSYYVYQSAWTDYRKAPMVHLFPYWDFNPGQRIDVRACTNAPFVELFVNGVSQGKQAVSHSGGTKLLGDWQVEYQPGDITAVAYDEAGREVARAVRRSFGDSKRIRLSADKTVIRADGEDLCFLTIETLDEEGRPVENAVDYVQIKVRGQGRLLGMDNGDSTDYDQYKTDRRRLFAGKLLAVVGSTYEAGTITVTAQGEGLVPDSLVLTSVEAGRPWEGDLDPAGFLERVPEGREPFPEMPPVRKVELLSPHGRRLDPVRREVTVEALIFPQKAAPSLRFQTVNEKGIETCFASARRMEDGQALEKGLVRARVSAWGDGDFLVRCLAGDGERVTVISQLEFQASGLGRPLLNPYQMISAGLYTDALGEIGNGNEKGVSTARDGESGVFYRDIDFGAFGSDQITLWVFALSDEAYPIEIWTGGPKGQGGRLLCTVTYQKPSQWNVYQEETYRLPQRLFGVASIGFVLHAKVHLKGFRFARLEKAFSRLWAAEADSVYGDSFRREQRAVRGIGNNVTLVYEDMDFTEKGADTVTIWGSTPLEKNTVHIRFTDENGERADRAAEFLGGAGREEAQVFHLEKLAGRGRVEIIFLPGSQFDLTALQFGRTEANPGP